MKGKGGFVYFVKPVGAEGPIKIGCANVPAERIIGLSAWAPQPLELIGAVPGSYREESFLHQCFADLHSHREWFRSDPRLLDAINLILTAGSIDVVRQMQPVGSIRKGKAKWTEERRLRRSYGARISRAERALRAAGGDNSAWRAPDDVTRIMKRWENWRNPQQPTAAEIAVLDDYLAAPALRAIVPSWKLPKDPICIPVFGQEIAA